MIQHFKFVGSSANITFWRDGTTWIEVLSDTLVKNRRGVWRAAKNPVHHVTIYRDAIGEIGHFNYKTKNLTGRSLTLQVNKYLRRERVS